MSRRFMTFVECSEVTRLYILGPGEALKKMRRVFIASYDGTI
jgi:hypothetical protein